MKKNLFLIMAIFSMISCSENNVNTCSTPERKQISESSKLTLHQAQAYASMYSLYRNDDTVSNKTRSSEINKPKELYNIDYFIENGDTLLYSFNYKNNKGYLLIAGDNSSSPILAYASTGNLYFNKIDKKGPFYLYIKTCKDKIEQNVHNVNITSKSEYYDEWKNIGEKGYEYEIDPINDEPSSQSTRARRRDSSNKSSIYPYTGKDLDCWCQKGGYNYYAKNNADIGCPAIAIGILMYDTSERITGSTTATYPSFGYYDKQDLSSVTGPTETAKKLRQIADSIPNYQWGNSSGAESGAKAGDILSGLHKLGYKKAELVPYNFETLYQNLSFKGYNYFGQETTYNRGVLIAAYSPYGGGHIWFCDGYYEQEYTVTKKFLGIKVKSWKEYDDRLYMNWGWGINQGNGWYCATDNVWTSLEGNPDVNLKTDTQMYINLSYYENHQYI